MPLPFHIIFLVFACPGKIDGSSARVYGRACVRAGGRMSVGLSGCLSACHDVLPFGPCMPDQHPGDARRPHVRYARSLALSLTHTRARLYLLCWLLVVPQSKISRLFFSFGSLGHVVGMLGF